MVFCLQLFFFLGNFHFSSWQATRPNHKVFSLSSHCSANKHLVDCKVCSNRSHAAFWWSQLCYTRSLVWISFVGRSLSGTEKIFHMVERIFSHIIGELFKLAILKLHNHDALSDSTNFHHCCSRATTFFLEQMQLSNDLPFHCCRQCTVFHRVDNVRPFVA